ncbi:MAG: hypothetical protein ABIU63_14405 [Chitinophagaceae bacterium]
MQPAADQPTISLKYIQRSVCNRINTAGKPGEIREVAASLYCGILVYSKFAIQSQYMEKYAALLHDLYNRIPRRHTAENVQELTAIVDEYTAILGKIESINAWYEKNTAGFYPSLETIQGNIKMSNSSKHSKKAKDELFGEASGNLKDDIESLIKIYGSGKEG